MIFQAATSSASGTSSKKLLSSQNVMWWTCMLTAVLAIPAIASIVVVALQPSGMGAIAVFILSCWLCVYAGIKLVKNPKITFPYMLEHITFTDEERNRCVYAITGLNEEMEKWKRTYERCDTAFMGMSKQPVWGHLEELSQTLSNIKYTVSEEKTIQAADLRALNAWLLSPKPTTVDAYLHALRGAYAYGSAVANEQGRDLDKQYPELEKGMLQQFEQAPNRLKAFAWELLSDVRRKYPFVAAQLNYAASESRDNHLKLVSARVA